MRAISLFSGVGGFEIGLERAGIETILQAENDPWCLSVLARGSHNFRTHNLIGGVRRLTPLECERLQGWPDDWTKYTADNKEVPDSHRYRMIGNGVASPCAEWIGHRLVLANSWLEVAA